MYSMLDPYIGKKLLANSGSLYRGSEKNLEMSSLWDLDCKALSVDLRIDKNFYRFSGRFLKVIPINSFKL